MSRPQSSMNVKSTKDERKYNWLSFSIRYLVNVEDLNNVESAGNYIRHRRAPVIFKEENGAYMVVYAPAVSGEMVAHGYQMNLVELALQKRLPVDDLAKRGILIKRGAGDEAHKDTKCREKQEECEYEFCVIQEDIVEDVAGFLNPTKQVKRVSNVAFSYMVPALDTVKVATITPQFHVRYTNKSLKDYQSLYNVEVSSASYVLTGYLNIAGIGKTQNCRENKIVNDKQAREEVAINALMLTLTQFLFGAKQTRFKPIVEIEALAVSFSEKPFNLPPINRDTQSYIDQIKSTAKAFAKFLGVEEPLINYYIKDGKGNVSTPIDAFKSKQE